MADQGELMPIGTRRKKNRKSSVGALMGILAKEHKKLYGVFYRPKREEYIFASNEIKRMLAEFHEGYVGADAETRAKIERGPYGAFLKSTMQPVRVLAWCIRHIYAGSLKDREFPFAEGFRSFKHIIWATRLYRDAYEENWYERRWRSRITVGEEEKIAAPDEAEPQEPELSDEQRILNAQRRRDEFLRAIEEGGIMGVQRGSKRVVCKNTACEKYGKTQWLKPEWVQVNGYVCKVCEGAVELYKASPKKPEKGEVAPTPEPNEPQVEERVELEPTEGEQAEDDSWLEGNEPEEISRPKEDPMHPGGPAAKLKIGTLAVCDKCEARFYVNEHTRGCHTCGHPNINIYKPNP